jgi:hypothetical protein
MSARAQQNMGSRRLVFCDLTHMVKIVKEAVGIRRNGKVFKNYCFQSNDVMPCCIFCTIRCGGFYFYKKKPGLMTQRPQPFYQKDSKWSSHQWKLKIQPFDQSGASIWLLAARAQGRSK